MSLGGRRRLLAALLGAGLAVAGTRAAPALETDQYLAWDEELEDSTPVLNDYLNRSIARTLERLGTRAAARLPCERLPPRIYRDLFPSLLYSRWRRFLGRSPEVDRFPDHDVRYFGYLGRSIYRRPAFPFVMPLGRTLSVGGVHVGIDKLGGHMFGFGRRYYKRYLRARRQGHDEERAMREAIEWGLSIERFFVGGLIDGVFSHADLEANYRGLLLARDLCEAEPPHLVREEGRWRLVRPVDLADYVSPLFDESYNPNHYVGPRWPLVRSVLVEEVCPRRSSPSVVRRMRRYRDEEPPSLSKQVVAEFFERRGRDPREEQSLPALCGATAAGASSVAATGE